MEPACSNIAMQRIVNDHTSYMTRVRTKFKMDREIFGNWSTSVSAPQFESPKCIRICARIMHKYA